MPSLLNRLQRKSRQQAGMSLVEMMVSVLVFSLGALAVLTMTAGSFQANNFSRAIDEGTNLGRTKMDHLMSLDYADPDLVDVTADGVAGLRDNHLATSPASDPLRADFSEPSGRYQVLWNIAANTPVNGAKTIAVIVSWQGDSALKQVVFQSVKAE